MNVAIDNIFYGTRGNREGKIMIVGESWGPIEAKQHLPFVGETGKDLERLLFEAKISISDCFFTNVVSEQPLNNDMKNFFYLTSFAKKNSLSPTKGCFPHDNVKNGLRTLQHQIARVNPKLVIGLGAYSCWALTDVAFDVGDEGGYKVPTGISQWRGSQLYTSRDYGAKYFLPTYHPAAAMRTHAWRYMIRHDLTVRVPKALNDDWKEPPYAFTIQPSFFAVTSYLSSLLALLEEKQVELVLDLETSVERHLISCIGLSSSDGTALCIPLLCRDREEGYWNIEEEVEIVNLLRMVLSHRNLLLIGHNLLFDLQYLIDQLFVKPRIFFDTMIAQHVLWPGGGDPNDPKSAKNIAQGIQRKALYNCASLYCSHYYYWKDEGKDFEFRDELQGWSYNCRDCVKTREVYHAEKKLLSTLDLSSQFAFQMRVANDMALAMMVRGIRVEESVKKKVGEDLKAELRKIDEELENAIPLEVRKEIEPKASKKDPITGKKTKAKWFTSSAQQKKIFYDFMGIKPVLKIDKETGERRPTLNKEALPILAQREPILAPLVEKLEIRRSIGVFSSTFAEAESEPDGRIRCSYNVTGTDTFRFSSSKNIYGRGGNLQNIPSGKEEDAFDFPNMRRYFEPDPGYQLAEFDLSGADAQIVAWEAEDEALKEAQRKGLKLHLVNARTLFPKETANMTDEDIKKGSGIPGSIYDSVKKGTHASNYAVEPETLARRLKWSIAKAEEFQDRWFSAHPGIKRWHERTERHINGLQCWKCDAMTNGAPFCPKCKAKVGRTIRNKWGYRIVYFDFINDIRKKALAWNPQSSVAINCNKGAIAMLDNVPHVELLLQVHDSLIVQYPQRYSLSIPSDIKKHLHSVVTPYADPLTIQWSFKASNKSWGDCEAVAW